MNHRHAVAAALLGLTISAAHAVSVHSQESGPLGIGWPGAAALQHIDGEPGGNSAGHAQAPFSSTGPDAPGAINFGNAAPHGLQGLGNLILDNGNHRNSKGHAPPHAVIQLPGSPGGFGGAPGVESLKVVVVAPPVPEPGTYALMLTGIAAVAWTVRRKSR